MEEFGNVANFSKSYNLLRILAVNIWHRIWYRQRVVVGKRKLPQNTPLIFAPNHQNALMDALALLCTNMMQIVWLARADIFKNPTIRKILFFMKILPVYRQRDGANSLGKNEATFNKTVEILSKKQQIGLFPETTHWGYRRLRATKKAVPRIAFMAEEKNDYNLGLLIVPVGLYYDNYTNFRKNLIVFYGQSFPVGPYIEQYKENENKGYMALRKKLDEEMSKLMIDIKYQDKDYELIEAFREIVSTAFINRIKFLGYNKLLSKFFADKAMIEILDTIKDNSPEQFNTLLQKTKEYTTLRDAHNYRENTVEKSYKSIIFFFIKFAYLLLSLPLFIYGFTFNAIQFILPNKYITERKIKDVQFRNSVNFVLGILLFPIMYFIYTIIFSFSTSLPFYYSLIFFASLPITGLFAFNYYRTYKKTLASFVFTTKKKHNTPLLKSREELIALFMSEAENHKEIINNYKTINKKENIKSNLSF